MRHVVFDKIVIRAIHMLTLSTVKLFVINPMSVSIIEKDIKRLINTKIEASHLKKLLSFICKSSNFCSFKKCLDILKF